MSFAFAQSVRNPATPIDAMSRAPESIASLITLPPSSTRYVALMSPKPAAFACFSISFSLDITISGKYNTPNPCEIRTSETSARTTPIENEANAIAAIARSSRLLM